MAKTKKKEKNMVITLGQVWESTAPLHDFIESSPDLDTVISYKLVKLHSFLLTEARLIEQERLKLVKKYGVKQDGGDYKIDPVSENHSKFISDISAIFEEKLKLDIPADGLIAESDLTSVKGIKPGLLKKIMWLLK